MGYEIDFIPVGESKRGGDAIALRFGNLSGARDEQTVIVIDGGTKDAAENLVTHIKTYYKTSYVNLVVSTHPDDDHASGLSFVLDEFKVDKLWMHKPWDHTDDIKSLFKDGRITDNSVKESLRKSLETAYSLEQIALKKGIQITEPFRGEQLVNNDGRILVLGPTEDFYESLLPEFRGTPEPKYVGPFSKPVHQVKEFIQKVAEALQIETLKDDGITSAENNSGTILLLTIGTKNFLFTGDAGIPALTLVIDLLEHNNFDFNSLKFIQVPHHGSKRNVGPSILNRILGPISAEDEKQRTAFVSVPKEGEPKHPSKKVTNAFRRRGAPVHVTKGVIKYHYHDSPKRDGWVDSIALPLFLEVED